jgi:hypothetical protein
MIVSFNKVRNVVREYNKQITITVNTHRHSLREQDTEYKKTIRFDEGNNNRHPPGKARNGIQQQQKGTFLRENRPGITLCTIFSLYPPSMRILSSTFSPLLSLFTRS